MINLKNWSINDWLDWARSHVRNIYITGFFDRNDDEIRISGDDLFINYIKVEWDMDEIDIDDDTNTITILKGDYTIECQNVYAHFKGVGYIYVCWEEYVRTKTDEFEITIGEEEWTY